ncbi:MAG: alpha-1,4-glucan--maltose-1-phosphate maltosyltransferase [Ferrimicrobium sp.]
MSSGQSDKDKRPARAQARGSSAVSLAKSSVLEIPETVGRVRPIIEGVAPTVDGGRFPAKRVLGETVVVEADIFADGHDELACELRFRHHESEPWSTATMTAIGNDRWRSVFRAEKIGVAQFSIRARIDTFASWKRDLGKRAEAQEELASELLLGATLLEENFAGRCDDVAVIERAVARLREFAQDHGGPHPLVLDDLNLDEVAALVQLAPGRTPWATSPVFSVVIDRERALFGSWYEFFPRSASRVKGRSGTLKDAEARLDYVASLGFDVLYLPPIHPIGRTNRKGRDGSQVATSSDPGSPWAIGSAEGGHMAIHPDLGSLEDFDQLVASAANLGVEIALDLAYQCSPDHPWVGEHPEWFQHRPDGTIRYAENPPKRYEDIYPLDFGTDSWRELWRALREIVLFWIDRGVRIFRVDNPHTKPLGFWEWLISTVKADHPEVLFLAEAFTRPRVMEYLAKVGFSQSVTYFTWRTTKWELESYLIELTTTKVADYLRPNFWPNTPDILPETLQSGGRPAFIVRLVLAATLAATYGIYGPVFELMEHEVREPGSEEYLHSEKFSIRHFDLDRPGTLAPLVARLNEIRRSYLALQQNRTLRFHYLDNEQLLVYAKTAPESPASKTPRSDFADPRDQAIVVVVNLDTLNSHSGWVDLDLTALGIDEGRPYEMHDLLSGERYRWEGRRNFVLLDPEVVPVHVFAVEQDEGLQTKDDKMTDLGRDVSDRAIVAVSEGA